MSVYVINKKFQAVPPPSETTAPSDRILRVAEMFGIGLDESYEVTLYDDLRLDVRGGDVVYITGPSGGGKSVLLRCLAEAIQRSHPEARLVDLSDPDLSGPPDRAVIEGLSGTDPYGPVGFEAALRLASTAGLADAFLLLRSPDQLSDGQCWRLRLAHALARLGGESRDAAPAGTMRLLVADELASTLDRPCARAIAYRLRRVADRWGVTILAASAHDDLVDDLAPDVVVVKHAGAPVEVHYADPSRGEEIRP